jgi:hypothetical protein
VRPRAGKEQRTPASGCDPRWPVVLLALRDFARQFIGREREMRELRIANTY